MSEPNKAPNSQLQTNTNSTHSTFQLKQSDKRVPFSSPSWRFWRDPFPSSQPQANVNPVKAEVKQEDMAGLQRPRPMWGEVPLSLVYVSSELSVARRLEDTLT
ncbi:hypothetical protein DPEC_G00160470 [Dallia pectoralis]|uniref:Uncharacterized protein n=1 Tax=Dallia pectoralis TaxID=75939 RepID=A0ACC2GG35_DALPE|nr:hypothetical protein DPEC_G00160470 [Dallia pectoralis]